MKLLKALQYLVLFAGLAFVLTSCSNGKKKAKGLENEIFVVADSSEYYYYEPVLQQIYGKVVYTPQPENLFHLQRKSINSLEEVKPYKNIIIIAPLDSRSYTSRYINSLIDSKVRAEIEKDSAFVFNKHDLWAKDQLVMILTGPNKETLKMNMLKENENLLYYFTNVSDKRIGRNLFNPTYEKKDIEARTLFKYGWMMYAQADYQIAMEKPEDNFVWLRREPNSYKERWVFVHWIENASPAFLDKDSIINRRNQLTKKYMHLMEGGGYVEFVDEYFKATEVNFNDKYAICTQGLWQFSDVSGGGPFINYTYYDEKTKRIYMLDAALLAPKYKKRGMLQQLDVLLHSFKSKYEVDPEKIEDLKDYYEEEK
ncbi:MAG: DUF4837 family protein [Rhodothermaceae bacterium]